MAALAEMGVEPSPAEPGLSEVEREGLAPHLFRRYRALLVRSCRGVGPAIRHHLWEGEAVS
jgi:hypothetical protein